MTKLQLIDESGDKKYFTQIPNYIANHSTANDQALYFQMKRYAGEDGKCFATSETLMRKLGIGRKAYNKSLKYLLDKQWVKFVGTIGGKTRPIKTYAIVDIWKINILEYEKIPSESTVSLERDKSQKEKDKSQKHTKISAESTVEEEPTDKEPIKKITVSDSNESQAKDISEIITLFKEVNPSYSKFFANKTQRSAVSRLLIQWPRPKLDNIIKVIPQTNTHKYAPTITTPLQLEDNIGRLIAFIQKERTNPISKVIKV